MKNKQQGMVLILVVSILALLSLMSVTFVRMMVYEQVAASNSGANSNARLIAQCGIEEAKARLWKYLLTARENNSLLVSTESSLFSNQNTNYTNFWYPIPSENRYYDLKTAVRNKEPISLHANAGSNEFSASGYIGIVRQRRSQYLGSYEINGNFYALQIEDNQGKLNINSHRPKRITDNMYFTNCKYSNLIMNNLIKKLAINCNLSESSATSIANALRPLNASEPPLYTNLSHVRNIVKRNAPNEDTSKFLYNICINSWMDKKTQVWKDLPQPNSEGHKTFKNASQLHNIQYYIEYRSPININTVSLELLATIIEELKATVFTCSCQGELAQDAIFENQQTETQIEYVITPNRIQFSHDNAMNIASELIGDISNRTKYYNFHELDNKINDIVNDYWNITESNDQKRIALQQLPKDVLKANFNPNARENAISSSTNAFINAVKGDLYVQDSVTGKSVPTHTTELCFWCNGYASITSLGMITANNHTKIIEESIINEQVAFGDWTTHTTQHDFFAINALDDTETALENPNNSQSTTNTRNNCYIFPDETAEKEFKKSIINPNPTYSASKNSGWIELKPNAFEDDLLYKNTISGSESSQMFVAMKQKQTLSDTLTTLNFSGDDYNNSNVMNNNSMNNSSIIATNYDRTNSSSSSSSLANYQRNIKFWMKFNGNIFLTPYKSGIYAETRFSGPRYYIPFNWDKNPNHTTADIEKYRQQFREGSQLYIYKNINNQLRISSTYFCRYYIENQDGTGQYQGIALTAEESGGYYGLALGVDQDYTTDPNCKYTRLDGYIDLNEVGENWQPNSWHHFNITTDSNQGTITCSIDGEITNTHDDLETKETYKNDELHPAFCIANDTFTSTTSKKFINGFQRKQRDNDISKGELILFREAQPNVNTFFLSNGIMAGYNTAYTATGRYDSSTGTFSKTISTNINHIEWADENTQYHPDWAIVGMLSWIGYSQDPTNHITVTSTQHGSSRVEPEDENNRTYDMLAPNSNNQTILSTTYTITLTPDNKESPVVDSVSLQVLFPQVISSEIIE